MRGAEAFNKLLGMDFQTVLDIGSGEGKHARAFRDYGKEVTTISLSDGADYRQDYCSKEFIRKFDCIWASHVLEHQPNPNYFLKKCFRDLAEGGILAVTVPPMKPDIVGGHLTLWNAGLLLYHLILAGFDCSEASVKTYGYNISVIVIKKTAELPELVMDHGDIAALAPFFPMPVRSGFNGNIEELNW